VRRNVNELRAEKTPPEMGFCVAYELWVPLCQYRAEELRHIVITKPFIRTEITEVAGSRPKARPIRQLRLRGIHLPELDSPSYRLSSPI